MSVPIAMNVVKDRSGRVVHNVRLDPEIGAKLEPAGHQASRPAVLVTRRAALVGDMAAGLVDADDVIAVVQGDWQNALLLVVPEVSAGASPVSQATGNGDDRFIQDAQSRAKSDSLATLAADTLKAIRAAGVDGDLVEQGSGRWVNRPTNTFTLKVQPTAGNIAFTLYGNPNTYEAGGFLLQDQNSYSRGWIRSKADVQTLARLAVQAHSRRQH